MTARNEISTVIAAVRARDGLFTEDELRQILPRVNSMNRTSTGGITNCFNCAIAVDDILALKPRTAQQAKPADWRFTRYLFRSRSTHAEMDMRASDFARIKDELLASGPGARGIIREIPGEIAHAFNIVHVKDVGIRFLDGQEGRMYERYAVHDLDAIYEFYRTG